MRFWRYWWNTLVALSQTNPPQLVELIMFSLAIVLLGIGLLTNPWLGLITHQWSYLALCLTYVTGFCLSVILRETLSPSASRQLNQVVAFFTLIVTIYSFALLVHQT
jgi:multisubunit Na+/H+ antiporter MnhE subunit